MEIPKLKNTIELKNLLEEFNSRLRTGRKLVVRSFKINKYDEQKEK